MSSAANFVWRRRQILFGVYRVNFQNSYLVIDECRFLSWSERFFFLECHLYAVWLDPDRAVLKGPQGFLSSLYQAIQGLQAESFSILAMSTIVNSMPSDMEILTAFLDNHGMSFKTVITLHRGTKVQEQTV